MQVNFFYFAFGRALQRTCPSSSSTKSLLSTFSNATTPHRRPEISESRPSFQATPRPCRKHKRNRRLSTQCEPAPLAAKTVGNDEVLEGTTGQGRRAGGDPGAVRPSRVVRVYKTEHLQRPWLPEVDRKVNYRENAPDLLKTLRKLGYAQDIPNRYPGRSNLSFTDHKLPMRRTARWMDNVLLHRTKVGLGLAQPGQEEEKSRPEEGELEKGNVLDPRQKPSPAKGGSKTEGIVERFPLPEPTKTPTARCVSNSLPHITSSLIRAAVTASQRHTSSGVLFDFKETDEDLLSQVFTPTAVEYLAKRNYAPEDVVAWSWILLAKNSIEAGLRIKFFLKEHCPRPSDPLSLHEPLPAFVYLFTLRRKPLTRQTLLILLPLARSLMLQPGPNTHVLELKSQMVLLLRLIRRCGEELVSLLPKLGDLAAQIIDQRAAKEVTNAISFSCNKLLALFGRQTLIYPYANLPYRWQPQLSMVKVMLKNEISITREGYRGLVAVQLAREKSAAERLWIKGMRESWPPWRDQRDSFALADQRVLKESMASIMLEQMTQAGYHHTEWEHSSDVLAGTDFDGKPTIPTRTSSTFPTGIVTDLRNREKGKRWENTFSQREKPFFVDNESGEAGLDEDVAPGHGLHQSYYWASKIRTTRTQEEAFAQFLACTKAMKPTQRVYFQMFEKLVHAQRHSEAQEITPIKPEPRKFRFFSPEPEPIVLDPSQSYQPWEGNEPVPGESRAVYPTPRDPSLRVHLSERLPDIPHLVERMVSDGLIPSAPLVALLISHAQGLGMVSWILRTANIIEGSISSEPIEFKKKKLDKRVLSALLNAMIRSHTDDNIRKSIRILFQQNLPILAPWKAVLEGLGSIFFRQHHQRLRITTRQILSLTGDVLRNIPPVVDFDPGLLSILSMTVRRFINTETKRLQNQSGRPQEAWEGTFAFEERDYWQGLPPDVRVIHVFEKIVGVRIVEKVRKVVTQRIAAKQQEADQFWLDFEDSSNPDLDPDHDDLDEDEIPVLTTTSTLPPNTHTYDPTPDPPQTPDHDEDEILVIPPVAVMSDYIRMLRRTGQFREIIVAVIIYRSCLEAKIRPSFGIGEPKRKRNLLAEIVAMVEKEREKGEGRQAREVEVEVLSEEAERLRRVFLESEGRAW